MDLGTKLTRPDGDVSFISPERVYPHRGASVLSLHRGHAKGGAFAAPIRLSIGTVIRDVVGASAAMANFSPERVHPSFWGLAHLAWVHAHGGLFELGAAQ